MVKENKTIGMTTDAEGNYRLRIPDNKEYTLQASFIGYVTQSHPLQTGQDRMDFAMEEDAIGMETVVVTGTRTPCKPNCPVSNSPTPWTSKHRSTYKDSEETLSCS